MVCVCVCGGGVSLFSKCESRYNRPLQKSEFGKWVKKCRFVILFVYCDVYRIAAVFDDKLRTTDLYCGGGGGRGAGTNLPDEESQCSSFVD